MRGSNVFGIDSKPPAQSDVRRGFTLIELLVVMGLIGFLASMLTYALLGAQADARVARTRGTITKLNDVILAQWEEYRYRPVDMRRDSFRLTNHNLAVPLSRMQAHLRMLVLRDTMRMEMPDRVGDILFEPSLYTVPPHLVPSSLPPELWNGAYLLDRAYPHKFGAIYNSLYQAIVNSPDPEIATLRSSIPFLGPAAFSANDVVSLYAQPRSHFPDGHSIDLVTAIDRVKAWEKKIHSSELLYLIVANSQYAGSPALGNFRASEIGDPDEDGLLEFIDAWGNAIQWIRWPTGFPSDLNRYSGTDAMDPLLTDWRYGNPNVPEEARPRTIVPLIFSPGPDEQNGITTGFSLAGSDPPQLVPIAYATMRQGSGVNRFYVDPFFTWDYQTSSPNGPNSEAPYPEDNVDGYRANQLGSVPKYKDISRTEENNDATDNITNHDIILGL